MSGEHDETIYILDEMTAKPGQAEALLAAYMEKYAPAARERGMILVHRWVTPPLWLKEQSNTLYVIWTVQGAKAWWQMSFLGRRDPRRRRLVGRSGVDDREPPALFPQRCRRSGKLFECLS